MEPADSGGLEYWMASYLREVFGKNLTGYLRRFSRKTLDLVVIHQLLSSGQQVLNQTFEMNAPITRISS
jgi:hypothetical protein